MRCAAVTAAISAGRCFYTCVQIYACGARQIWHDNNCQCDTCDYFCFHCFTPCCFFVRKNHQVILVVRRLITISWIVCLFNIFATLLTGWFRSIFFVVIKNARVRIRNLFRRTKRAIRPHHGNTPWHYYYKRIFSALQLFRAGRIIKKLTLYNRHFILYI